MKLVDKLAWLYVKDRKVLFVRSKGNDIFYTVGGKREGNESDEDGLVREIKEELDVTLISSTIKFAVSFDDFTQSKGEDIHLKILCHFAEFKGTPKPSSEIEEMMWVDSSTKCKLTNLGRTVIAWLKEQDLVD